MINPTITKADTFASAIPSTLFPAYAKIIIAATTLSIVANIDIINVVHNDISDTEQKESSTKETMAANKTEISNGESQQAKQTANRQNKIENRQRKHNREHKRNKQKNKQKTP